MDLISLRDIGRLMCEWWKASEYFSSLSFIKQRDITEDFASTIELIECVYEVGENEHIKDLESQDWWDKAWPLIEAGIIARDDPDSCYLIASRKKECQVESYIDVIFENGDDSTIKYAIRDIPEAKTRATFDAL